MSKQARDLADSDIDRARVSQENTDLARGLLMAQYGVDADVAMRVLRRQSQHTNRKLR
ncbi:ANTAR domain-containing protein [Streptomyces sp. NPDC006393]|uniref:ANTAR domain-containing protein n=1 Tax=Streptomyces sp. NPDC006393 TaxID=3156763 RepID=UPI003411821F